MRSILLFFVIMIVTPSALLLPHLGVYIWAWISIMNPHRLSWGLSSSAPFVLIIGCVTLLAWLMSREPKAPPSKPLIWLALAFLAHVTISTFDSIYPPIAWLHWEQTLKTFVLFFVAAALINSKVRIQGMLWILAISLGFFATRGVLHSFASGGNAVLEGPRGSMLSDNNHLALSLVMLLPILNYLRVTSVNKLVRLGVFAVMAFALVAVIASYSRGALIALGFSALWLLRASKGRFLMLFLAGIVTVVLVNVMPQKWKDRIMTLESAESIQDDSSFSGRTSAWYVSWQIARRDPLTGGGFRSVEHLPTFVKYQPEAIRSHAAHSIYFQVLGEHGFIGLAFYLLMMAVAWFHLRRTEARARGQPGLFWAWELSKMLQTSMIAFAVGGAALSIAYHDLILLIMIIALNVDVLTEKKAAKALTSLSVAESSA